MQQQATDSNHVLGNIPYRMALAGGWIDQPFTSRLNPDPPGSMVVVNIEPDTRFMDRAGMGTSTRRIAHNLWHGHLPGGDPMMRVRELYLAENQGKPEPSGSQDMAGLLLPGINRLDYDSTFEGGYFPIHIESCNDPEIAAWLQDRIHFLPINQRPEGYNPLQEKNLDPRWIQRLGQSGKDCYTAILQRDLGALGESMNECMRCWEAILPNTVYHPTITIDLKAILSYYQRRYQGAMYSGCGGGYLLIASEAPIAGTFRVNIRIQAKPAND